MSTTLTIILLGTALAAWRIWVRVKPKSAGEKAASRQLRRVLRHYAGGVWMIDTNGFTSFANAEMGRLLGGDADNLHGRHFRDFLRDAGGEALSESFSVSSLAAIRSEEHVLAALDGSSVPSLITGATLFDTVGRSSGALLWVSDLSERKRLVQRVEKQKGLLEGVTESSSVAIAASDRHGLISYANPAIATLVALTKQEMIGRTWSEVLGEKALAFTAGDADVIAGGGQTLTLFTFGSPPQARTYRFAVNAMRNDAGDITGVVRMGRDLTDELRDRKFLATYRQIFEALRDAAVLVDRDYRITHVNRQYADLLSTTAESMVGRALADVVGEAIFARDVKDHIDKCLAGQESSRALVQRDYGGKIHTRDVMYFPIRYEERIDAVAILSRNISELFKTGDLAMIDEAERSNSRRDSA